ncbi:transglycosylase SLT domain-containing protein [Parendozoicomonas haliclonae]|nr:transglycosylase SLT domain-containing protein [Parendozoicomonas haliclonae]
MEAALKKGNSQLYLDSRDQLEGYPLTDYLESLYLANRFDKLSQKDIDRFVARNPDLPQAYSLQYQWLRWLAAKKHWKNYLIAYDKMNIQGGRYQCFKGRALLATGQKSKAWKEAEQLWLVGKSQDKTCDMLFTRWKKAGGLTQKLAAQRFWLAVDKRELSLARYIDRSITAPQYKNSTRLFWRIHKDASLLAKQNLFDGKKKSHQKIMLYGINRLISKDKDKAADIWLALRNKHAFDVAQIERTDKRLALKFAKNFTDNADEQIARIDPAYKYPEVTKWRIRLALSEQNWGDVLERIQKLPPSLRNKNRWSYWDTVARLKLNNYESVTNNQALVRLSQERSFYGFLVAGMTELPFQLNHQTPEHSPQSIEALAAKYRGFARIGEWLELERVSLAQSELNRIRPRLTAEERKLLPYLAKGYGWHHQAIMAAAREALWNDLELRFPSPESSLFARYSKDREIDGLWALSIARQESAFNARARSHAGARGLMQLMPGTAKQAARKGDVPYRGASDLYNPEKNISIGTAHLAWLAKRFEGNTIYATAAYNAGSSAVKRWLAARGDLPLDIWIETIPYDETRGYVQNVLAFRVIYGLREQGNVEMFTKQEAALLTLTPEEQTLIASNP